MTIPDEIYDKLLDILEDYCPHTIGLLDNCSKEKDCRECWDKALKGEVKE